MEYGGIVTRGMSVSMAGGAVEMCLTAVQTDDNSACWVPLALLKRQEVCTLYASALGRESLGSGSSSATL